jgi:exodeoxyribonuclease-5
MSAAASLERPREEAFQLTNDQKIARLEILKNMKPRRRHLLEGEAGTGKTFLTQEVVREAQRQRKSVAWLAPTHKVVGVGARKMRQAGLEVPCATAASFLGLDLKPGPEGRLRLERRKYAEIPKVDVVILDEGSLIDSGLWGHCERLLSHAFILVTADFWQLWPVEDNQISPTSAIPHRSVLTETVRQAEDNPILHVARAIRRLQEVEGMDRSWCKPCRVNGKGVYLPSDPDAWMRKAFTSPDFAADNDAFRYLCWTNDRVTQVNARVRQWIYGETDTPFAPGERVLARQPITRDDTVILNNNDEAVVKSIRPSVYRQRFQTKGDFAEWSTEIDSWEIELIAPEQEIKVHIPRDDRAVSNVLDRLASEARGVWARWKDYHSFRNGMGRLQAIYAQTIHTAQGSTHAHDFVDLGDISRCRDEQTLKKLLYVAASRPTTALMFVGT